MHSGCLDHLRKTKDVLEKEHLEGKHLDLLLKSISFSVLILTTIRLQVENSTETRDSL